MSVKTFIPPAMNRVPDFPELSLHGRIINENFKKLRQSLLDAIEAGTLIGDGSVTEDLLSTEAKTLVGDVTGTIGAAGSTTVEKIRGKTVSTPVVGDDAQFARYNHGAGTITWEPMPSNTLLDGSTHSDTVSVTVAKGKLVVGNSTPKWDGLAVGADGEVLTADAAQTLGVKWAAASGGTSHTLLDGSTHTDTAAASVAKGALVVGNATPKWDKLAVGTDGYVLTADSGETLGVKWASAAGAGTSTLLDGSVHTDTVAGTVVRGDIIVGNSTPKWERVAIGAYEAFPMAVAGASGVKDTSFSLGAMRYYPARGCMVYNAQNAGNAVGDGGGYRSGITVLGTRADGGDTVRTSNKYTSATTPSGSQAGPGGLVTATLPQPRHYLSFRCDFKLVTTTNGVFWCGLTTANITTSAPTGNGIAAIRFFDGTDTNFRCYTCDGAGGTQNQDSTVAKDGNWHDLRIETPDAGVTYYFYIDGALVQTISSNVPSTTAGLGFLVAITILSTGTADEIRNSYIRFASGPHLFS